MTTDRNPPIRYRLSLLGRLVEPSGASPSSDLAANRDATLAERSRAERDLGGIRKQLILDLDDLFRTTRAPLPPHVKQLPLVQSSIRFYGLPDFSKMMLESEPKKGQGWQSFRRMLTGAIEHFEPRISQVVVSVDSPADAVERGMVRLHIAANLRLNPLPQRVTFDAELPVTVDCLRLPEAEQPEPIKD